MPGGLPHRHPSLHCYKHHKCRCDDCVEIAKEERRRRTLGFHNHPSLNCYNRHGCRCDECCKLKANVKPPVKSRVVIPNVLPEWEVARLRKLVGYHENVH